MVALHRRRILTATFDFVIEDILQIGEGALVSIDHLLQVRLNGPDLPASITSVGALARWSTLLVECILNH